MNRFETLMAPTCCSTRELAMIAGALEGVPVETKNKCRTELLDPKTRMYDELTTVRMEETYDGGDNGYALFCESLAKSGADPIPLEYAGAWFTALLKTNMLRSFVPQLSTAGVLSSASRTDPWFLQGAAAIARRIAINAETTDGTSAAAAWLVALDYYEQFFKVAAVENSFAFGIQKDAKQMDECRDIWSRFFRMQAEETAERLQGYVKQGKTIGIASAISILEMPSVKRYCPGLYENTLAELKLPYKNAIQNALSLKTASELYTKCPAAIQKNDTGNELLISMIGALRKECERLSKGHGDCALVILWGGKLNVRSLMAGSSALVKVEAKSFFEACANQIRNQLNKEEHCVTEAQARDLRRIMPPDFIIAHQTDGSVLTVSAFTGMDLKEQILERMAKNKTFRITTANGYKTLGKQVWTLIAEGTEDTETRGLLANIAINQLMQLSSEKENLIGFLSAFPNSLPLKSEMFETIEDLLSAISAQRNPGKEIVAVIEASYVYDTSDGKNLGEDIWRRITAATTDRDERASLAVAAFNALCNKTKNKEVMIGFLIEFPSDLPVRGLDGDGIYTIKDLTDRLLQAYIAERPDLTSDLSYPHSPSSSFSTSSSSSSSSSSHSASTYKPSLGKRIKSMLSTALVAVLSFILVNLFWIGPGFIAPLLKGIPALQVLVVILSFVPLIYSLISKVRSK